MKPEKLLPKRINRAIGEYGLIQKKDKVLIALSGGKDSLALTRFLPPLGRSGPLPFSAGAVHVKAPWEDPEISRLNRKLCGKWDIPYEEIPLNPREEGMNCVLCSRLRRKALLSYGSRENFDSVALGHHMEDCLETFLMNLIYQSRLDPLLPSRTYPLDNGREIKIIRPLILAQEALVQRWSREQGFQNPSACCPWEKPESRRKEMRGHLEDLTGRSAEKKAEHVQSGNWEEPRIILNPRQTA